MARAAVAHVVTGFTQHQPSLIRTARNMLKQLQQTPDVCIAAGVCQVLLGNVDEALKCIQAAGRCAAGPSPGLASCKAGHSTTMTRSWPPAVSLSTISHTACAAPAVLCCHCCNPIACR